MSEINSITPLTFVSDTMTYSVQRSL